MKTSDFDFHLPPELIAQHPLAMRSASRLLVVDRQHQSLTHQHFTDVPSHLKAGDVLVLNDTKVLPARLFGIKEETGAHLECLILRILDHQVECLVKKAKTVKMGTRINFGEGRLILECTAVLDEGLRRFAIRTPGIFLEILAELGTVPLPPYIKEKLDDPDRYQTVYAKYLGSAAAPTAGLHFTPELLDEIRLKGVTIVTITLHVGLGTFRPVEADDMCQTTSCMKNSMTFQP
jgi:S-adenosylmethionine:tRNA ribosyltransferase-isomerase